MSKPNGSFNFSGTGLVAIIALVVLGGGALAFSYLRNQSGSSINIGDIKGGEGGTSTSQGGSVSINEGNTLKDSKTNTTSVSFTPQDSLLKDSQSNEAKVDTQATNVAWSLKYPTYQKQNDKCVFLGAASTKLNQLKGGELYNNNTRLNIYELSSIQGSITSSGKATLSLASDDGKYFVSLESKEVKTDQNETLITGKATMPGCPESTFELKK